MGSKEPPVFDRTKSADVEFIQLYNMIRYDISSELIVTIK